MMELKQPGKIYSSGNSFTTRAALLQSYYRETRNEPCGETKVVQFRGKDLKGKKITEIVESAYVHMVNGGETLNKNFFFDETHEYAKHRVENKMPEETIKADRLFNNLLSSMPMAFNLFHPLMRLLEKEPGSVTKIVSALFPAFDVYQVEKVDLEFIPTPIENYTNDKSAMDALIIFSDQAGQKSIIAIECKYTDSLGANKATDNTAKYQTAIDSNLFTQQGLEQIEKGCTQIFRNFLLTEKYRMVHGFKNSYSVILAPKDNPTTDREIDTLSSLLQPDYQQTKLTKYTLEDFVKVLRRTVPNDHLPWIDWFYDRYLDFGKIEQYYLELKNK